MKKNTISLNETQLHNLIKESVRQVISEAYGTPNKEDSRHIKNIVSHENEPLTHAADNCRFYWDEKDEKAKVYNKVCDAIDNAIKTIENVYNWHKHYEFNNIYEAIMKKLYSAREITKLWARKDLTLNGEWHEDYEESDSHRTPYGGFRTGANKEIKNRLHSPASY